MTANKDFPEDNEGVGWRWLHFVLMLLVIIVAIVLCTVFVYEIWTFCRQTNN